MNKILDKIKELGNKPIFDVLEHMGGWPILKGADWNDTNWSFEKSLLKLREFVGYNKNVFRDKSQEENSENEIDSDDDQNLVASDEGLIVKEYPKYMYKVAVALGAADTKETEMELNDALRLALALNTLSNEKLFRKTSIKKKNKDELMNFRKLFKWINHFDNFKLKNTKSNLVQYNISIIENIEILLEKFSSRTIANYALWRVVELAVPFLGDEVEEAFKFLRETYGYIDKEQRWKTCIRITNLHAELATGSLYIKDFFTEESRIAATNMVQDIKEEFRTTISNSDWMDEKTKSEALKNLDTMKSYIGYDEQLLNITKVEKYYVESSKKFTDTFFHLALQLNVLNTDKKFRKSVYSEVDWTKYAKPTTIGASYNRGDNTIREIIMFKLLMI